MEKGNTELRTCDQPGIERTYTIRGIAVRFPYNAYPSQLSMMNKILSGLGEKKNCLLESPTGSGKSLALLCSTLAWQKKLKEAYNKYQDSVIHSISGDDTDHDGNDSKPKGFRGIKQFYKDGSQSRTGNTKTNEAEGESCAKVPPEKPPVIFYCTRTHKQIKQIVSEMKKCPAAKTTKMTILSSREHSCIYEEQDNGPSKFYGMSKNERCKKLRDPTEEGECSYHQGLMAALRDPYRPKNAKRLALENVPWDIEDLTNHGKKCKICPFYLSRELQKSAEIILCPYNYIIDPRIRNTMSIELQDNVIILDEAHNIEDVARSAGSCTATHDELDSVFAEFNFILERKSKVRSDAIELYQTVKHLISSVCHCSLTYGSKLAANQFQEATKVFTGIEFLRMLDKNFSINAQRFYEIMDSVMRLAQYEGEDDDQNTTHDSSSMAADDNLETSMNTTSSSSKKKGGAAVKLSTDAWAVIESLSVSLGFLFKAPTDFRIVFVKKYDRNRPSKLEKKSSKSNSLMSQRGGWLGKNKSNNRRDASWQQHFSKDDYYEVLFNIWCMSPATVFRDLTEKARCILLASGTLSPVDTFASELGCAFPVLLEAPHVIKKTQIWTGTVSQGFNTNIALRATFQNTQQLAFQDEVGNVLLEICKIIPHGVLFFLPSYKLLTMLIDRWKSTGAYHKLQEHKTIFQEPQKGGSAELNEVVRCFNVCIATSCEASSQANSQDASNQRADKGALFIAVCRGKVSEGIDFADEQARAVVTLGIPFPNIKDIQVDLKRRFNDEHSSGERKLLSGSEWYEVQAFRALNQALGRCIRHRNDWGAVILIDDRFACTSQKYIKSLPKWIRGFFREPENLAGTLLSLRAFVDSQKLQNGSQPVDTKIEPKEDIKGFTNPEASCCDEKSAILSITSGDVLQNETKSDLPRKAFNFTVSNETNFESGFPSIGLKRRTVEYNYEVHKTSTPFSKKMSDGDKIQNISDENSHEIRDDSEECINIPESPDLDLMVPFKYPKHGTEMGATEKGLSSDQSSGVESVHLRSIETSANGDILCKSTYPEDSNELFDDSSIEVEITEEDQSGSKVSANCLRCVMCKEPISATDPNSDKKDYIFECFDSLDGLRRKQIRDNLQSILPKSLYSKFFNPRNNKCSQQVSLFHSDSEIKPTGPFHLSPRSVETESGVYLNCQLCEELQVVWQPLTCGKSPPDNSPDIVAVRIIHSPSAHMTLPKLLLLASKT